MSIFFKSKSQILVTKLFILFKNKSLYKSYLYKYNTIVYIPLTISDKNLWFNIYRKVELKKIEFNW